MFIAHVKVKSMATIAQNLEENWENIDVKFSY